MSESEQRGEQCKQLPELTQREYNEMKDWFYFFDKNNDKRLDKQELGKVFCAMCWDLTPDELETVMVEADKNKNGYIEYDEYMILLNKYRKDPQYEKCELIEAFRVFDRDRSGYFDKQELRRFLMCQGDTFGVDDDKALDDIFTGLDKDGDGRVDIDEFVSAMMSKPTI